MRSCLDNWQGKKAGGGGSGTEERGKIKCSEGYTELEIKDSWFLYPQEAPQAS